DLAAFLRGLNDAAAREVVARDGTLLIGQLLVRPRVDDLTAADTGQRPDVDDPIACLDRLLVVLDDHEGVAEVAQRLERTDETSVVALVQADRRLVEHVEHAREPRTDLRRKTDALRLPA